LNGSREVARILIKYNANLNLVDKENKSALMIATINGNLPLVEVLVENGANMNVKNKFGRNLYDLALGMDRKLVVKYFENRFDKFEVKSIKNC
jgi:uncharacterized protein